MFYDSNVGDIYRYNGDSIYTYKVAAINKKTTPPIWTMEIVHIEGGPSNNFFNVGYRFSYPYYKDCERNWTKIDSLPKIDIPNNPKYSELFI